MMKQLTLILICFLTCSCADLDSERKTMRERYAKINIGDNLADFQRDFKDFHLNRASKNGIITIGEQHAITGVNGVNRYVYVFDGNQILRVCVIGIGTDENDTILDKCMDIQ
jgi:hypothetical protein